jgi:hypothetical protein
LDIRTARAVLVVGIGMNSFLFFERRMIPEKELHGEDFEPPPGP